MSKSPVELKQGLQVPFVKLLKSNSNSRQDPLSTHSHLFVLRTCLDPSPLREIRTSNRKKNLYATQEIDTRMRSSAVLYLVTKKDGINLLHLTLCMKIEKRRRREPYSISLPTGGFQADITNK